MIVCVRRKCRVALAAAAVKARRIGLLAPHKNVPFGQGKDVPF